MSYNEFVKDLNEFYKVKKNSETHYEIAQTVIRDIWIKNGKYDELIDFILENWDSGNCDDFIEPFEKILIYERKVKKYSRLWTKIICYRLKKLLDLLKDKSIPNTKDLDKIDVSNFNITSVESYKNQKRVLAFYWKFVLDGIHRYQTGLSVLDLDAELEKLNELQKAVIDLDVYKIVNRHWC